MLQNPGIHLMFCMSAIHLMTILCLGSMTVAVAAEVTT